MNKDKLVGEWDEFKGRVKRAYAELTDDDYVRAQGSVDKLVGIIEQRYGEAKEKILAKIQASHAGQTGQTGGSMGPSGPGANRTPR